MKKVLLTMIVGFVLGQVILHYAGIKTPISSALNSQCTIK